MLKAYAFVALLTIAASACAGPSFNTNREKLDERSREAGAKLQEAVELTHRMYRLLELRKGSQVEEVRQQALAAFAAARDQYEQLAKDTPLQPLKVMPNSNESKDAESAFRDYCKVLKLKYPDTERELAAIAITIVEHHRQVLAATKLSGTAADYPPIRMLMKSEAIVMDVGIVTSIVWTIAPAAGR